MGIEARFNHELVVHRLVPGTTANGRGDRIDTYEPGDPFMGNVQQAVRGAPAAEIRGREPAKVGVASAIGFLPIDTAITGADYLQHGDRLYEVIGPPSDAGGRGKHLEAELLLVVA